MFVIYHKNMECFLIFIPDMGSWYMFMVYVLDIHSWYEFLIWAGMLHYYALYVCSWYMILIWVLDICFLIHILDMWVWYMLYGDLDICSWYMISTDMESWYLFLIGVRDICSRYIFLISRDSSWYIGRTNLISSIKEGGWTLYAFPPVLVASEARVGRAAGHVKADFCYDRLMGRTNGCRCSQRGENRWGLWWSGRREQSSGRGNFFVALLQLRIVVFWVGERNKGGGGRGEVGDGFFPCFCFSLLPLLWLALC